MSEETSKVRGEALAQLLLVANITEEERASWEALVPSMDEEQLNKLHLYLSAKLPEELQKIIEDTSTELADIIGTHEQKRQEIDQKAEARLDLLESQLNEE